MSAIFSNSCGDPNNLIPSCRCPNSNRALGPGYLSGYYGSCETDPCGSLFAVPKRPMSFIVLSHVCQFKSHSTNFATYFSDPLDFLSQNIPKYPCLSSDIQ